MSKAWAKSFYNSKQWKKTREYVLMRDKYLCVECESVGEEIHHVKHLTPENIKNPMVSINPDNCILLCKDCHFKKHQHKKDDEVQEGYRFDDEGYLIKD